jgi:hypothetical protein
MSGDRPTIGQSDARTDQQHADVVFSNALANGVAHMPMPQRRHVRAVCVGSPPTTGCERR